MTLAQSFLSFAELQQGLDAIRQSPQDGGALQSIVVRPVTDGRLVLSECELSPEAGLAGDRWVKGSSHRPDTQVTLMNARAISLIAQTQERWSLAGDNLYVDLDLSSANLPPGQQLAIGSVILQITDVPHTGCAKFAQRYGADAVSFVNSPEGKQHSLRGIYARICQAGVVRVGDTVRKIKS